MHCDALIERLQAAPCGIAIEKLSQHAVHDSVPITDLGAHDQFLALLQHLPDLLPARDLAGAGVPGTIGEQNKISREEWSVCTTEVEQHAVISSNWNHAHTQDTR
jgi:hypothetical protein